MWPHFSTSFGSHLSGLQIDCHFRFFLDTRLFKIYESLLIFLFLRFFLTVWFDHIYPSILIHWTFYYSTDLCFSIIKSNFCWSYIHKCVVRFSFWYFSVLEVKIQHFPFSSNPSHAPFLAFSQIHTLYSLVDIYYILIYIGSYIIASIYVIYGMVIWLIF